MTEQGNTGVAGGTKGADPVPEKKAPDDSTALPADEPEQKPDEQDEKPEPVG